MMTLDHAEQATAAEALRRRRIYWGATGLFCLLFVGSAGLTFFDPGGTRANTVFLGYPAWTIYPLAVAKLLGVATVLLNRWHTLKMFAFAGFLFDMLLASGAHIAHRDPNGVLAAVGLVLWVAAFSVDRLGFRAEGRG